MVVLMPEALRVQTLFLVLLLHQVVAEVTPMVRVALAVLAVVVDEVMALHLMLAVREHQVKAIQVQQVMFLVDKVVQVAELALRVLPLELWLVMAVLV